MPEKTVEPTVDFDTVTRYVTSLSYRAQATFLWVLTSQLSPNMCKKLMDYAAQRLEKINRHSPSKRIPYERRDKADQQLSKLEVQTGTHS